MARILWVLQAHYTQPYIMTWELTFPPFSRVVWKYVAGGGWKQDARTRSRWFRTSPPVRARKLVICLSIRPRAWKKESVYGVFNVSEREEIWPPVEKRENFGFQRVFAEMCIGSRSARGTAMFAEPLPRIISGSRGLVHPRAGGLREGSSSICRLRVNRTNDSSPSGEHAAGDIIISLLWVGCTEPGVRPGRLTISWLLITLFCCCELRFLPSRPSTIKLVTSRSTNNSFLFGTFVLL